jgi:hypothetical protein
LRSLLTRLRAASLVAALAVSPAIAVAAAPASHAATAHHTPARLKALSDAKHQLGDPYRFGAAGPNAFECSGLTMRAYGHAGNTDAVDAYLAFPKGWYSDSEFDIWSEDHRLVAKAGVPAIVAPRDR